MIQKYSIYQTLLMRLKRCGFKKGGFYIQFQNSGSIAYYLCELFIEKEGLVYKDDLIAHKIISSNESTTNEFLIALSKTNFIKWNREENKKKGFRDYQTFASFKIVDLLNKENEEQKATKKDVLELRNKIYKLESCVKKIIHKCDPPVTDTKIREYMQLPEEF